jgi:lipooligosaccharide transport system permease protein
MGQTDLRRGAGLVTALRLTERNIVSWRGVWLVFVSVLVEPLLFLLAIGVGVGALVGDVPGPGGEPISYRTFVATGLLAASAMFGPVFDTTFNFFVKLKYLRFYHGVLATPMRPADVVGGELLWALLRAATYAGGFLAVMAVFGLVESWWALLSLPTAVLIGHAFAGIGLAASSWMRSFVDFDFVNMAIVPMFLLSATFFPLDRYPGALQHIVQLTPLYQGVVLQRSLVLGDVSWGLLLNAAYLAIMGTIGLAVATRRLRVLLLP